MKTNLKEIAEKVQKMINYEVSKIENNETKWKNQYENVMNELEGELKYTNEIIRQIFVNTFLSKQCKVAEAKS